MSKVRKGVVLLVTAATLAVVPAAMHASGASEAVKKPVPVKTGPRDGGPSLMGVTWQ